MQLPADPHTQPTVDMINMISARPRLWEADDSEHPYKILTILQLGAYKIENLDVQKIFELRMPRIYRRTTSKITF